MILYDVASKALMLKISTDTGSQKLTFPTWCEAE